MQADAPWRTWVFRPDSIITGKADFVWAQQSHWRACTGVYPARRPPSVPPKLKNGVKLVKWPLQMSDWERKKVIREGWEEVVSFLSPPVSSLSQAMVLIWVVTISHRPKSLGPCFWVWFVPEVRVLLQKCKVGRVIYTSAYHVGIAHSPYGIRPITLSITSTACD